MITYTVLDTDDVIVGDQVSEDITVNMPVTTGSGKEFKIKNINTSTVYIVPNGADTIDGAIGKTLLQWESLILVDRVAGAWVIMMGDNTISYSFGNNMLLMGA